MSSNPDYAVYNAARSVLSDRYYEEFIGYLQEEKRNNPRSAGTTNTERYKIDSVNRGRALQRIVNAHRDEYESYVNSHRVDTGARKRAAATYTIKVFPTKEIQLRKSDVIVLNTKDVSAVFDWIRKDIGGKH